MQSLFLLMIPLFLIGFGWFFPIVGLIEVRNRIFGDPSGGSEGSFIEWQFCQSFIGLLTTVFFVWFYFNVSLTVFGISFFVWCLWSLVCFLIAWSDMK